MGAVHHHQAQARRFLTLARADHNAGDFTRAANALARAASHAATAALVHGNPTLGASRRKLTNWLFNMAAAGKLPFGAVKSFRQIYNLPEKLHAAADPTTARRLLSRARNRISAMIRSVERAIAGRPQPALQRRNSRTVSSAPPHPALGSVSAILALPNFKEIAQRYSLANSPLLRRPDPHNFYRIGLTPRPCSCHPQDLDAVEPTGDVPLSPLWQKALQLAFKTRIPDRLPMR